MFVQKYFSLACLPAGLSVCMSVGRSSCSFVLVLSTNTRNCEFTMCVFSFRLLTLATPLALLAAVVVVGGTAAAEGG